MKNNNIITFLLITIILINITFSKSINVLSNDDKNLNQIDNEDQYYLIFVNNTFGEIKIYSDNKNMKRQESKANDFVLSLVEEIHDIIVDNKDTFQNPEIVEEKDNQSKIKKRNIGDNDSFSFNDSKIVYPISSVGCRLVLYAYLSSKLVENIKKINCVDDVVLDSHSIQLHNYYDEQDILEDTNWKNLTIREDADLHLSLLSQGKYYKNFVHQYDNNYYYPSSAGKDIDIIIIDTSFNFKYSEYKNTLDREVKCVANIEDGIKNDNFKDDQCGFNKKKHGDQVSDAAGGFKHGAARKANIYGISVPLNKEGKIDDVNIFAALEYISEKLIKPHKTIINMSFGKEDHPDSSTYIHYKHLLYDITEKGGIIVVSAGNDDKERGDNPGYYIVPCSYNTTICVGGIDSRKNIAVEEVYKKSSFSNFGEYVDIYGPSFVDTEFINANGEIDNVNSSGTSFASPLTAGVIATIMSEHPETKFTKNSILKYLVKDAPHFSYQGRTNYIVNNGKHIVYSKDDAYTGCGINAGNKPCNEWCNFNSNICNHLEEKEYHCIKSGGLFVYDKHYTGDDTPNYACLTLFSDSENNINTNNSVCFYGNGKPFCIIREYTIYSECNLFGEDYNQKACINKIFNLTNKDTRNWSSNLRSYPYMVKLTNNPELDGNECNSIGGVFLKNDNNTYLCLLPKISTGGKSNFSGDYCIYAITDLSVHNTKDTFCVDIDLSNLEVCNRYSEDGNFSKCYDNILSMSNKKLYYIEPHYAV